MTGLTSIRGVTVDPASGSALITGTRSGRLVRVPLDGSGRKILLATGLTAPGAVITRAGAPDAYVLSRTNPAVVQRTELATGVSAELIS